MSEYIPNYHERKAAGELPVDELMETFLEKYEHDIPLSWFDLQLRPVFGIDVYASSFPKEQGYAIYHARDASVLLLKLESLEKCAGEAVKNFLGVDNFVVTNTNVGEGKEYKDLYRDFIDSIRLPLSYLDRLYDSEAVRHFYSDTELERFRARWSKKKSFGGIAGYLNIG
jgi:hypothetical protein